MPSSTQMKAVLQKEQRDHEAIDAANAPIG